MDESKDHEPRAGNVSESTVTVTTITTTTTETVIERIEGEGGEIKKEQRVSVEDGGACEGGDVMVEVLGSEVLVDGVRRLVGEVGSDELGGEQGDAGGRENLGNRDGGGVDGDRDGGGEVDDLVVMHDGVSGVRPGDQASCGAENLGGEPGREGASGNGISLGSDGVQESEAHDRDEVETVVEGGLEKKLDDEAGVTFMELTDIGNGLHGDLGSHDVEVRINQIENVAQHSTSQIALTTDGNKDVGSQQNVESVNDEGDDKHSKVVECPSIASESVSKEPVILEKGDERVSSEPDSSSQGNEILDGTVNRDVEFVEAPNGDDRSSCIESANCSSADLNSLRSEVHAVPEREMQDSSIQTQVMCDNTPHDTGKEEAEVIDSVTRDSETYNPVLSDIQAQVIVEEKNGNSVDDQQMDSLAVKIDKHTANLRAGDREMQSETVILNIRDNVLVNEEPESLTGNDGELTVTIRDNFLRSKEPKDSAGGTETGCDSKLTAASDKRVSENDGEVQCCEVEQKPVTSSEIDQNLKNVPVSHADMRSSDESSFSCGEEAGKMDMEVVLQVKDGAPKSEILQCVKDEKSNHYNMSSDPGTQANVEGNAMEIDDVDHSENQKDDEKIKLDGTEESDVMHPQLACQVEGTSVVGMDIDAVDVNSKEQGISSADHQDDSKSNSAMIVENQVSEAILCTKSGKGTTAADDNTGSVEGGSTVLSLDSTKEVIVRCSFTPSASFNNHSDPVSSCVTEFMDSASCQSKNVKVDNASGNEDETARLLDPVTDAILGDEVTQADDKIHKMDGELNMGLSILETEILDVSLAGSTRADSDTDPKQDTNEEYEGRATHEQPPFPDEPLVNCVDQGLKCEPETSIGECLDISVADDVAQVGSSAEDVQEMQEEPANPDVSIAGNSIANTDAGPRQDTDANEQPPFPDELLVNCVDQGLKCEPDTSIGECLDKSATDGVAQVGSSAEDIQEMQEDPINPDVSIAGNPIANTDTGPRQDTDACEQPCFPDELLVNCVDRGLKCEPETSIGECMDKSVIDDVAQVGSSAEDIQEMQEEPANPDISIAGNSIADTDADPRQDTDAHEQPPFPDELLVNCVDEGLECEPETSIGECLDKSATDGVTQVGFSAEGIQEMQEEPAIPDVSIAGNFIGNTDAGPTQDTDAHEQPPLPDESLVNCVDQGLKCEPETQIGECLDKSATDDVTQVGSSAEDVQEMQEEPANPDVSIAGNSIVDTDAGSGQDTYAHEQPPFPDELLVNCVDQGLRCEPETSIAECLDKSATDDVAQVGLNAEDIQEMQEEPANPDVSIAGNSTVDTDAGPKQDTDAHEQPPFPDELLVNCVDQGLKCEPETSYGECLDISVTDGVTQVGSNAEDIQEMQEEPANPDVSVAGNSIDNTDAGPRQDTDAHEQPPLPEESLIKCVDQRLECEQDSLLGECLDKYPTDGFAQADSSVEDIQEMHEQAANATQDVSMEAAVATEENMTKLHDPVTSVVVDKQVMHIGDGIHDVDEKLHVSTHTLKTEVHDVDDSETGPGQDGNEEFEGNAAHEKPSLPDESPVRGSDQGVECEPDTSLGEFLDKRDTDGINMEEGVHEIQEEAVITQQVEFPEEQEVDEDLVSGSAKPRSKDEKNDEKNARRGTAKPGSFIRDHRVTYQLSPENDGDFSVFDLVWGKVKSHPWWPGQIFHPSDSSEKAMKYYRKDCYLVAYFGDRSFAWNEASVLKPFRKHFSQEEKQSNTDSFQNAVNCALAEVSRRLELGLACSCISEAAYDKIKYQFVENAGIREESSKREGVDRSTGPDTFQSAKLIEYVRALALFPTSGADRLDLVIAKAQLLAFNRLNGCDALAEFQYYDGLMEYDVDTSVPTQQGISGESDAKTKLKGPHKRKHNLKDIVYQRRKEKSLTELMGETMYCFDGEFDSHEEDDIMLSSPTSGSKRKASGYLSDDIAAQQSTKTISFAKVSHTTSSNPQQSFKVGECIRRVASQLTGSPSIIKSTCDIGDDADEVIDTPDDSLTESTVISPKQSSSPEEMLSQLHLSARDPMKGRFSFLGEIIYFFSEFRNVAVSAQRQRMRKGGPGRKRKPPTVPTVGSPETFEFDDRNDSYWTDMVVSEAKPARRGRKRKEDQIVVAVDSEKPVQSNRRKYSRKQYFHGNHESTAEIPSGPTELMLNFSDVDSIPSEANLNKMFRRFGPLKESETEVDAQSSRARVVFKKRSDAEIAYSSAAMFNIFGSTLVNYQLNYTPSVSFGTPPLALSDTTEHHAT